MKDQKLTPWKRLIAADPWRATRLHDMRGHFVGFRGMITDLPRSIAGAIARKGFRRYQALPWIPYPAIRRIEKLIEPSWRVLEHGSGMSTIWWSSRVSSVVSIEADQAWFTKVRSDLDSRGATNVTLELRQDPHYSDLSSYGDSSFDFIVIDGHARDEVARQASRVLARPGWIYLDNTDFAAQWKEMYGEAEDVLRTMVKDHAGEYQYLTGLAPGALVASEGLLVHLR